MEEVEHCALCDRPLGLKSNYSRHHLLPIAKGGKGGETVNLHNICHRKIHAVFTNRELEVTYNTIAKIKSVPEIDKFVKWLKRKPIDFYERTRESKRRGSKRNWKRRSCAVLLLIFSVSWSFAQQDLTGLWENELGSQLQIDSVSAEGEVYGEYRSSSGVDGKVFPLIGFTNLDPESGRRALSFTVRWTGYSSITSWSGYLDTDADGAYIKTLWHLVRPTENQPWERIISNASTFRPLR